MTRTTPLLATLVLLSVAWPAAGQDEEEASWMLHGVAGARDLANRNAATGMLLYFLPEGATEVHPYFKMSSVISLSRRHPFAKIDFDADLPLRAEYEVDPAEHTILVCDKFGNPMLRYEVAATRDLPAEKIQGALYACDPWSESIRKKLEPDLKRARDLIKRGNHHLARRPLLEVLEYRGFPEVAEARELMDQVEAVGLSQIDAALDLATDEARIAQLKTIRRRFEGCSAVEARVDEALADLGQ